MEPASAATSCPDHEVFHRLLLGELSSDERRAVQDHIDGCDACDRVLVALMQASLRGGPPSESSLETSETRVSTPVSSGLKLKVGDAIDGFEVLQAIGSGGMGDVYLARDAKLGRRVALKVIRPRTDDPRAASRFLVEARAMARFNHPNLVSIYAAGEYRGQPYVALEYVKGKSLKDRMAVGPLGITESMKIARDIALALAEAHRYGVIHRDLKPANIVIGADGRARVLDFGLALFMGPEEAPKSVRRRPGGQLTSVDATSISGTPRYMAPEQWRGEPLGGGTDVWALGVIIYEMVTGQRPFAAGRVDQLAERVTSGEPPPPMSSLTSVPLALEETVARCLQQRFENRPSAAAVATAIDNLRDPAFEVSHESLEGMPQVDSVRPRSKPRRSGGIGGLGLALGVLMGTLAGAAGAVGAMAASKPKEELKTARSMDIPEPPKWLLDAGELVVPEPEDDTPPIPARADVPEDCDPEHRCLLRPLPDDPVLEELIEPALMLARQLEPRVKFAGFDFYMQYGKVKVDRKDNTYSGTIYFAVPDATVGVDVTVYPGRLEASLEGSRFKPIDVPKCTAKQAMAAALKAGLDPRLEGDISVSRYRDRTFGRGPLEWTVGPIAARYEIDAETCRVAGEP